MDKQQEVEFDDIKDFFFRFKQLNQEAHSLFDKCVSHDISSNQTHLLFVIGSVKDCNQKMLAKRLHITPATLSVRIKRLETSGLLTREIDPNDKRNYILKITAKAQEEVDEAMKNIHQGTLEIFKGFTKEDIDMMTSVVNRLGDNIKKIKENLNAQD